MNRKSFLKALVGGTAAAVVLPSALSACDPIVTEPERTSMLADVTPEDVAKEWKRSGELRFEWSVYQVNSRGESLVDHRPIFRAYDKGIGLDKILNNR